MCHAWGFYLMAVNLSLFARDVLQLPVVMNGLLSSLPYIGMFCMTSTAKVFDMARQKKALSLTNLRKVFTSLGMVIPAVSMLALNLIETDNVAGCFGLLTIAMMGHNLGSTGGYYLSHSDMAGPFSGTLFGITNTMAQIPGFANALLVAYLTPNVRFLHDASSEMVEILVFRAQGRSGWWFLTLPVGYSCLDAWHMQFLALASSNHGPRSLKTSFIFLVENRTH